MSPGNILEMVIADDIPRDLDGAKMSQPLRILIVEDDAGDTELLVRELRRSGLKFDWKRVETEAEYLAELNSDLHLILSDYEMPQFDGLRALQLLKQHPALDIPFILVSGTIGEEKAAAAIQQGAADYLLKDRITRLPAAVSGALKQVEERSERKRLEARFIEVQKMEVVGHFAGGVAHDFNNALAIIMGYTELIMQDLGPGHPLQKYVEEVLHAAKRAAGLTQQLLIFSRKQTVKSVLLDLNSVVESMDKMLRRLVDESIEIKMVCGKTIGQIKADSGYVWQVLMNLVINARDAMPNGGKLAIETSSVLLDEEYAKSHPGTSSGDYAVLSVSDNGIGMTEAVKARLFEAFFTTKPIGKGTGLGLVTCQTIVRQSGGHIEVSSGLGKGTTFRVYFPQIRQSIPLAAGSMPETGPWPLGSETLLVVEDEPSLRRLAQGVLQGRGYEVLTAANGQDALTVAREHQGQPISLVITDVIMPRMGGKAMGEWLKVALPEVKILFTSGYTGDTIAQYGILDEDVEFLPKPYTPAALARKVRDLLDS